MERRERGGSTDAGVPGLTGGAPDVDFDLEKPATGERFRAGKQDDLGHPALRITQVGK
jgi:hypothetical protein